MVEDFDLVCIIIRDLAMNTQMIHVLQYFVTTAKLTYLIFV